MGVFLARSTWSHDIFKFCWLFLFVAHGIAKRQSPATCETGHKSSESLFTITLTVYARFQNITQPTTRKRCSTHPSVSGLHSRVRATRISQIAMLIECQIQIAGCCPRAGTTAALSRFLPNANNCRTKKANAFFKSRLTPKVQKTYRPLRVRVSGIKCSSRTRRIAKCSRESTPL